VHEISKSSYDISTGKNIHQITSLITSPEKLHSNPQNIIPNEQKATQKEI
jgi:hypothetical protein